MKNDILKNWQKSELYLTSCAPVVYLELDARFGHSPEGVGLPVDLLHLLPHDHVETRAVLVSENKPGVVVICYRVYMKRPFKIHSAERSVT